MVTKNNKKTKERKTEEHNVNSETFQNKQLRNIILIMGIIILAGIITYLVGNSLKNQEYQGLEFTKIKEGSIDFYSVKVPAISPITGKTEGYYEMMLRTNPKDLGKVDYTGRAKFLRDVVLSFDKSIEGCEDNVIAVANMAKFLTDAGFRVKGASHNYDYAQEVNMTYADCYDATNKTVIVLQKASESLGEKTNIKETVPNCYVVNVAQCQTLPALERIMVEVAISAANQGK